MSTYQTGNTTASRELQIPIALEQLENEIARNGKLSEELSIKLEKVCTPLVPNVNPKNDMAVPVPPCAEYVDNLKSKADKLRRNNELLENILSRLEL